MLLLLAACHDPVDLTPDLPPVPSDETVPQVLSSVPCEACGGDCLLEELAYQTAAHTTAPIDYQDVPPAGGPHHPCWSEWGVLPAPVPDDHFVHNLEHGGIVWLHSCEDCPEDVAALESLVEEKGIFALVTAYPEMDSRFSALSWGWRLTTGCLDLELFSSFYDEHVDQAPESIPVGPSGACM